MNTDIKETVYISFVCPTCRQEIEVSAEMAELETECPACAASLCVPAVSAPGTLWGEPLHRHPELTAEQIQAMKSRTIRIELADW